MGNEINHLMSSEELRQLKAVELKMLIAFIEICQKHQLRYFLLGGTLLGAVRHGGFIPWDDDIDVGMPRPDYEKFLQIAPTELTADYFLQNHQSDPEYPQCFSKIRDSSTTFIETSCKNLHINHGVYIDIFPLDGCPEQSKIKKYYQSIKLRQIRISNSLYLPSQNLQSLAKNLIRRFTVLRYPNLKKTIRLQDEAYKKYSYDASESVANYGGAWGMKEIMPRSYFGKGVSGTFEGITVTLPEKYDAYLTHCYGDYMTPPPPEQQVGHHYCTVVDLNQPYQKYMGYK